MPPATLPARLKFLGKDMIRNNAYTGLHLSLPSKFPISTMVALRVLTYFEMKKDFQSMRKLTQSFWTAYWINNKDISCEDVLIEEMEKAGLSPEQSRNIIHEQIEKDEIKNLLKVNTDHAINNGAFGAPFFIVTTADGTQDTFFGSDRFHHIAMFLNEEFDYKPIGKL